MAMLKRILLGAVISWCYAATLGLLFAACASGRLSFSTLWLPGVIPVALIGSTVVSIAITPIAAWSVRTGARNLCVYGPILWGLLVIYIVVAVPVSAANGLVGLVVLSVAGLVVLGFIPATK